MIGVYFATNRNLEAKSPPRFGNTVHKDGPHTLRYGLADEVLAGVRHVLDGRAPDEIPNREAVPDDRGFRLKPKKPKSPPPAAARTARVVGKVPWPSA